MNSLAAHKQVIDVINSHLELRWVSVEAVTETKRKKEKSAFYLVLIVSCVT